TVCAWARWRAASRSLRFATQLGESMFQKRSPLAVFLGTASFLTISAAQAQQQTAVQTTQAQTEVPEQVLITGSLIRGAAAVGVPVTNLGNQDLVESGALTIGDLFRTV